MVIKNQRRSKTLAQFETLPQHIQSAIIRLEDKHKLVMTGDGLVTLSQFDRLPQQKLNSHTYNTKSTFADQVDGASSLAHLYFKSSAAFDLCYKVNSTEIRIFFDLICWENGDSKHPIANCYKTKAATTLGLIIAGVAWVHSRNETYFFIGKILTNDTQFKTFAASNFGRAQLWKR